MGYTPEKGRPQGPSVRVGLRVSPGAARSEVVGRYGEGWKVRVAARAERGRANDALLELLAETFGVARTHVRLVAGQASKDKLVEVDGLTAVEAEKLLSAARRKGDG